MSTAKWQNIAGFKNFFMVLVIGFLNLVSVDAKERSFDTKKKCKLERKKILNRTLQGKNMRPNICHLILLTYRAYN